MTSHNPSTIKISGNARCVSHGPLGLIAAATDSNSIELFSLNNTPSHLSRIPISYDPSFLSWSPIVSGDKPFSFVCSGHSSQNVTIYKSSDNLVSWDTIALSGTRHLLFMNGMEVAPFSDKWGLIASVSDDCTLHISDLEQDSYIKEFHSPTTGVCWDPNDSSCSQLLVSTLSGTIDLVDRHASKSTSLIHQQSKPIFSIDWSSTNPYFIGAAVGDGWCVWDMRSPLDPLFSSSHPSTSFTFGVTRVEKQQQLIATASLKQVSLWYLEDIYNVNENGSHKNRHTARHLPQSNEQSRVGGISCSKEKEEFVYGGFNCITIVRF